MQKCAFYSVIITSADILAKIITVYDEERSFQYASHAKAANLDVKNELKVMT